MLKVIDSKAIKKEFIEIDQYIPFSIEFTELGDIPLYWHLKNKNKSLFEVGIDRMSGALHSITLTMIEPKAVECVEEAYSKEVETDIPQSVVPVFNLSRWLKKEKIDDSFSERFEEESSDFTLLIGRDFLTLTLNKRGVKTYSIGKKTKFGVDEDNNLCEIVIFNLSLDNIEDIKIAVNYPSISI